MALYDPLIDRTYFTGDLQIGQVADDAVNEELMYYVRRFEYEFMNKLMGASLHEAFYTAMQQADPAQKWKDMAYEKTFTLDAAKVKTATRINQLNGYECIPRFEYTNKMNVVYKGLVRRKESNTATDFAYDGYGAFSPIAKYVYYWWMRGHATVTGGTGESIQQTHNGIMVNNNAKMVRAWNAMCREVFEFYLFIDMYADNYPEFTLEPVARFNPAPINEFNFL